MADPAAFLEKWRPKDDHVGYYDNPSYVPNIFWQGPGIRYPSTHRAPYMKESPYGMFQPSSADASDDNDTDTKSKRKYIIAAIIASATLVIVAVVVAVLVATLTSISGEEAGPKTIEKTVRKGYEGQVTMASKNWTDALNDKNSSEYKTTEADFIAKMDEKFRQSELGDKYDRTVVTGFQEGSVVIIFFVILKTRFVVQVVEDGTPTTTTEAPREDVLGDIGSAIDIGIQIERVLDVFGGDPEFTRASVSDVNECDLNPCSNGGTCHNGVGKFTCTCMPGYTGENCEAGINECDSDPCQHGGICNDQIDGYTCICVAGIKGTNCEINVNDCVPNPCKNAGRCVDGINQYTCTCIDGYEGENCETDINECEVDPCQNDGTCKDGVNKYTCICKQGYAGENCETDIDDCEMNSCKNYGTCIDGVNEYECECKDGYTGENCGTDIDDCEMNSCKNDGTCIDGVNKYECECKDGYTGENCEIDIDDCEMNPCKNDGTCKDGVNKYECECKDGYTGENCEIDIDDCEMNPCKNEGTCKDGVNKYECVCKDGYTGENCEIDIDDCEMNPCKHDGTCKDGVNEYECECKDGYTGENCGIDINDCIDKTCNHGVCVDGVNEFSCTCDAGWTDEMCDLDINECADSTNPCANSAFCQNVEGSFMCICVPGWAGAMCDMNVNECELDETLCKNGATCLDNDGSYTCDCSDRWQGLHCEIAVTTTVTTRTSPTTSTTSPTTKPNTETTHGKTTSRKTTHFATTSTTFSRSTAATTKTAITTTSTTEAPCGVNYILCYDGTECIPSWWLCDGDNDCTDMSDESNCATTTPPSTTSDLSSLSTTRTTIAPVTCGVNYILCYDGTECIPSWWLCDGDNDCTDMSDESNCATTTPTSTTSAVCLGDQFTCIRDGRCINMSQLCDGNKDCLDGSDEWYNCSGLTTPFPNSFELQIRLMDGDIDTTELLYGRVELKRLINGEADNEFGTICDDSWDSREAVVLCRSLNASVDGQSFAYGNAAYGEGSGPILFRNFHCDGNEERLEDCPSSGFGQTHCSHKHDAAISCGIDRRTAVSTSTSSTPVYTTPSTRDANIRLVNGENCLEGRIELFYLDEWVTICDDIFRKEEADMVCKSLGFGTTDAYSLYFEPGTGTSQHIFCYSSDNSVWDCDFTQSFCSNYEDVGIRCSGDPANLCKIDRGVPSVNCSFNEDRCDYNMTVISGDVNWAWEHASIVGMTDSENVNAGRLMLYENKDGSELDSVRIESPPFSPSADDIKVEFHYQLHKSSYKNLIFSVNEKKNGEEDAVRELWSSVYLYRDQEYRWLYQCVSLTNLSQSSNYTLLFTATRGPYSNSATALDNIIVSEGRCKESLLDGMCDFDRLSTCGMTVECNSCDRNKWNYRWVWQNSTQYSHITSNGYYMLANSFFGTEGDAAVMSFAVPIIGNKTVLKFWYLMFGENGGSLEVQLYEGDSWHSALDLLSGGHGNSWSEQCVKIPPNIDFAAGIKIKFKALCGKNSKTHIALDNVYLDTGECLHPVRCTETLSQCGWITKSASEFAWKFIEENEDDDAYSENIRLVDGPYPSRGTVEIFHDGEWGRVCDDGFGLDEAKVVCRMLGYTSDVADYMGNSFYGYGTQLIWLDDLRCAGTEYRLEDCSHDEWGNHNCNGGEHVAVICYGETFEPTLTAFEKNFFILTDREYIENSWTSISSREFKHEAGEYRFMFEYQKAKEGVLQVWYYSFSAKQTGILDRITDETDVELYCVDIPTNLQGKISVGITALKVSNKVVTAAVKDFALEKGSCKESLAKRTYTFENDYRLYGFSVTAHHLEGTCEPWYGWTRVSASTNKNMKIDHTILKETGHFMYGYGLLGSSELQLERITEEESKGLCSLQFYYFINDETADGGLFVNLNAARKKLVGTPKVTLWVFGCLAVVDTCGDEPGTLDITFEVSEIEAGIDDILLSSAPCPEPEESSVSCEFWKGNTCSYFMDPSAWSQGQDENLTTTAQAPGSFLVSQEFELTTNSCVAVGIYGLWLHTVQLMVDDSSGEIVVTTGQLELKVSGNREIYLDVPAGVGLRLYFEAYSKMSEYVSGNDFIVYYINVTDTICEHPGISCTDEEYQCGDICLAVSFLCDGLYQCEDRSDEKCECNRYTFNCTSNGECISPSLLCNDISDCTDGSDELDCGPSVNCTFNLWGPTCGYTLHNAEKETNGLQMYGALAYISSPDVFVETDSCLVINLGFCAPFANIRVSADDGEMYTVLYHDSTTTRGGYRAIYVDIEEGYYKSLVTETQSETLFDLQVVYITNITLFGGSCPESTNNFTTTRRRRLSESTTYFTTTGQRRSTTTSTTTEFPPPDNFPVVEVANPDITAFGWSATLSCKVINDANYQLIMYWKFGDVITISREEDIMLADEDQTKFSVKKSQKNGQTIYNLTINEINENDTVSYFFCVADVIGYMPWAWPKDGTLITTREDGCIGIGNTGIEKFCPSVRNQRVTVPTMSGLQTVNQVSEAMTILQDNFVYVNTWVEYSQCTTVLQELACGLHVSQCEAGNVVRSVCREHCQEIADFCSTAGFNIVSSSNLDLQHYCRYLPSLEDDQNCTEIWLGCDINIELETEITRRLRSENYPHGSPSSPQCNYLVHALPHYELRIIDYQIIVDDDCTTSYLQVNGEKLCSGNASNILQLENEGILNITVITNSPEQITGFLLSVSQVLPSDMCDIIAVFNFGNFSYDGYSTKDDSCSEWLFYSGRPGHDVDLNFTAIDGCLEIKDRDSNSLQEICNLQTEPIPDGFEVLRIRSSSGFKLQFSLQVSRSPRLLNFTIESIELKGGQSDNEGKVFITRSDGRSGFVCGYISSGAADVICRMAGFRSPALGIFQYPLSSSQEEFLLYELRCVGDEDSLVQCYHQEWEDMNTGTYDCQYNPRYQGVTCPLRSVSCSMTTPDVCGYDYDTSVVLQAYTYKFGDGLYVIGSESHATNISSPGFKYLRGDSCVFEYSLDGDIGHDIEVYLRRMDGIETMSIWKKAEYTLDGRFGACVQLPNDFINEEVQLVFRMSMVPTSVSVNNLTIGLHDVTVKSESCPEPFPESECSFNKVEVCDTIFSQVCVGGSNGTSVWKIKNNTLRGDSTYTLQNVEYPITFSVTSTLGSYIHFLYSQTGTGVNGNDLKLTVQFESITDGSETIFSENEFRSEMKSICLRLPSTEDEVFNISFVLTTSNSEGTIFLDDIVVNDEYCPHPVTCDFEYDNCFYTMRSNDSFFWFRDIVFGDHTSGGHGFGHAMMAFNSYTTDLEQPASFQTPLAYIVGDMQYKCLSFFYLANFSIDAQYELKVAVFYQDTNETVTHKVEIFLPFTWQEENIKVDSGISTTAQFSFIVTKIYGRKTKPLAIDDVALLPTKCIEGLQDLEQCDFSNPGLCGFETNCTHGSNYIWQVHSRNTTAKQTGPITDADGSAQGYYLFLDGSLGDTGHESYVWFKVDLADTTTQHYQFFYYMTGDGTALLETFYRDAVTNMYSEVSTLESMHTDAWFQSYCYQLPDDFKGEIYFYAVRGDSIHSDFAIDKISVMGGSCQNPSVPCEFLDNMCGYVPENGEWSLEGGYIASESGALHIPTQTLEEETCIRFEFESNTNNILTLAVYTDDGQEKYNYTVYTEGKNIGQFDHLTNIKGMKFVVPGNYSIMIDRVTAESGSCSPLACKEDEMACALQCIPQAAVCDRKLDCSDGEDESSCGFSISCEFNDSDDCGYATVPRSPTEWTVLESHTFTYKDTEHTNGILFTSFQDKSTRLNTSVSSGWQKIDETKCLRFNYLGTVSSLSVFVSENDESTQVQWTDQYADMIPTHWRPAQITVEPGTVKVSFYTSAYATNYTVAPPNDAFVAISKIELLSGGCDTHEPPVCPNEASFQCDNGSLCYSQEVKCDKKQYCQSGSDESHDACSQEFSISCDFENSSLCGWTIWLGTFAAPWKLSTGYRFQIPSFDHTKNDESGHFLHSVNWDNNNYVFERATVTSPNETFREDGCITFWYYLNSTATQPNALSAQILVSLFYEDSATSEFLWYDYVDRPINDWIQGGVPVRANRSVFMNVTSIQFETYRAWPGVVALDDVGYSPGECALKQECHKRSFECKDSRVCIPEEFVCDGKEDCADKSDEEDCLSRPDGSLGLSGGDGTYGQLRYFKDGSWRPVCYPSTSTEFYLTQWVCEQLGYKGNSGSFVYKLVDTAPEPISLVCDEGSCTESYCVSFYDPTLIGVKCSNTACFSGEKRCAGTDSVTCVAKGRFCDGLPDCPDNSDEKECYCKEGESRCTRTFDNCFDSTCETCEDRDMFECQNHQCIDKSKRCDGKKDCSDGLDEYRCVQINEMDDNKVMVYSGSQLLQVCFDNIGRDEADMLCSYSRKGLVANDGIMHGYDQIDSGIVLTETQSPESFLPGLQMSHETSCYPLKLHCKHPECGTAAYMDSIISPLIVHGNKAVPGEWPYHGVLRVSGEFTCGCSLLGGKWVITAAHCVEDWSWTPTIFTVMFGSTFSGTNGPHGQEFNIIHVHTHPLYNKIDITDGYDLALIELAFAPRIDNYTRPVCLGSVESWQEILDLGKKAECYITGFGADELYYTRGENPEKDLAETKVGIVDREKCKDIWSKYEEGDVVSHDGICLENREPYQPACYGDSGGPFVCKNKKGRWEQFGVASYGGRGCYDFVPITYFSLTTQLEWIESFTGTNFATHSGDAP